MSHTVGVVLVALLSGASAGPAQVECPGAPTLELLHAAVFHLDRGDDDDGVRRDLAEARARIEVDPSGAAWTRGFIERVEAVLAGDAGTRQYESEVIRRDLHESACLTTELHARFHRSLPPPGPAPGARPRAVRP